MKTNLPLLIQSGSLAIAFSKESGGLPSSVRVHEADGQATTLLHPGSMRLVIELADGRRLQPVASSDVDPQVAQHGATEIDFINQVWQDEEGVQVPEYQISLQHEFFPDGTAFTSAFFSATQRPAPEIVRMELEMALDFSPFDDVYWSAADRPKQVDGALIMGGAPRFLPRGESRTFESGLMPMLGFYMRRKAGPSLYAEFFMEGSNTLSSDPSDNASSVVWRDGSPILRWVIQKRPFTRTSPCQWRNQWGWVIRPAAATRHKPPLQMYHYFDNYQRYPDTEQVRAIADAGCHVLVFHENWRLDAQNGGIPQNSARLRQMLEELHHRQIRMAVYVRGNEESVAERGAAWFDKILKHDFDGLYVDYGGPVHELTPPDETFNGGRIEFRKHYLKWINLRKRVGQEGVLYCHTGPWFSALGLSVVDGYVAGEGEGGVLVRSRLEHEYFSMSAVCPGTLWAAAFPEYASPRMTPFIAASGQYPHSQIGRQVLTSSLTHPPVPGFNDLSFKNLWRIWSVMRDARDLAVFNDFNSTAVFPVDPDTGHYLMVSKDQSLALLVVSNFTETARDGVDCTIAWPFKTTDMSVRLLDGVSVRELPTAPQTLSLPGYGVAGLLFTAAEVDVERILSAYQLPPQMMSPHGKAYLAEVDEQKRLREPPLNWPQTWLAVSVPPFPMATYEDSLLVDLYDNTFELVEVVEAGAPRHVMWIDRRGAVAASEKSAQLFAGDTSPAINLSAWLSPGKHRLALRSHHLGAPFYSFCYAMLSPSADLDDPLVRRIAFLNDLEPDRSYLTFRVSLPRPD